MEKTITVVIILFVFFISCENQSSNIKLETETVTKKDKTIDSRIVGYSLMIKYDSTSQVLLSDENYRSIAKWLDEFEEDTLFQKIPIDELENLFIFQIQAGINKNISKITCNERIKTVEDIINTRLGLKDYKIGVFKTLKTYKVVPEQDNYLQIKLNKLLY